MTLMRCSTIGNMSSPHLLFRYPNKIRRRGSRPVTTPPNKNYRSCHHFRTMVQKASANTILQQGCGNISGNSDKQRARVPRLMHTENGYYNCVEPTVTDQNMNRTRNRNSPTSWPYQLQVCNCVLLPTLCFSPCCLSSLGVPVPPLNRPNHPHTAQYAKFFGSLCGFGRVSFFET